MNWHTKNQEPKKNVPVFQGGGSTPAPPTQPVVRVVLLHKSCLCNPFCPEVYVFDPLLLCYYIYRIIAAP